MTNSTHSHSQASSHLGRPYRGFTLVEIAVVLTIVGILLAGLLPTISSQIEQQRRNETRKQMEDIQQALIGYAMINGRLPCPADGTQASNQAGAGIAATTGTGSAMTCSTAAGVTVLPWATLGVNETDAWGRRFTYSVTMTFADGADGTGCAGTITSGVSFQLCSAGNLSVQSAETGGTIIASNIPAVIVSHGSNGLGGYTTTGQRITGASGDELGNADADPIFINHDFVQNGFDDLVVWLSPNILVNRMVTAGKLP